MKESRQTGRRGVGPRGGGCVPILVWLSAVCFVHGETIVLKSGQSGTGTSFRRQNNAMVFMMELRGADGKPLVGPDGTVARAERSVPVSEIAKVVCEPPAVLKSAPALLAGKKAAGNVLAELATAVKAAEPFGDLPGSWWPQLLVLQANLLVATGKDAEAGPVAGSMASSGSPDLAAHGKALQALLAARKGDHAAAALLVSPLWKERAGLQPSALAAVLVARGLGFLEKKQFVPALKSFLEVPVFMPDEAAFASAAQWGAAQAYYGLEDYDRAISTAETLVQAWPGRPETAQAQTLLPQWQRRRSVVNEARGT